MQISFDQAQALCAIVDQGGYTQASHRLHKSHSALIYLIKTMEDRCGFPLFDRNSYRNRLTPSGQRVYQKCLEILSKVDELSAICTQFGEGWEPSLKLVIDGILPFGPMLELYKRLKNQKVPTVIQSYTAYLEEVEASFESLNADVMISVLPVSKKGLKAYPLKPVKSFLVAHRDHLIHKERKTWKISELQEQSFLTIRGSGNRLGLNTEDFEKFANFFLSDFSVKKKAIMEKSGFGWLPEHLISKELQSRSLLLVKWERESTHVLKPTLYVRSGKAQGPCAELVASHFV